MDNTNIALENFCIPENSDNENTNNDNANFTQEELAYLMAEQKESHCESLQPNQENYAENGKQDFLDDKQKDKIKDDALEVEKKNKTVPHGAFHEERKERKKAQAELTELKMHLEELHKIFQNSQSNTQGETSLAPQKKEIPDPTKDPIAFMKHLAEQQKILLMCEEKRNEQETFQKQEQAIESYWKNALTHAQKSIPDFLEASHHLYTQRYNQLKALARLYPDLEASENIDMQIGLELRQIIENSAKSGIDPISILYNFAKETGYQAKDLKKSEDLCQTLENLNNRQNSAKTLTSSAGKNSAEFYSLEAINAMSEGEFSSWIEKPQNEQIFNKIMGSKA